MKKIIGILLAGALVTSAFAADFSVQVKMKGSLANFDGTNFKALSMGVDNGADYNQLFATSVTADKAGSEVKLWLNGDAITTDTFKFKVWIQPIDMLKLTFGNNNFNLNQESIDWWRSNSDAGESFGYSATITSGAFSADIMLGTQSSKDADGNDVDAVGKFWFDGKNFGRTALKVQYGADFGTINALFTADNFKDMKFGAGYKGAFGPVNMWANVLAFVNGGFYKVRPELFANGSVDAFSWAAFVPVDINLGDSVSVVPGLTAKLSYQLASCGIDLYINKGDLTKWGAAGAIQVRPGVRFNIGSASMEIQADMNIGDGFTVDVPLMCNLSW